MRVPLLFLVLLAAPSGAQQIGARDGAAERLTEELGIAPGEDESDPAIAAANAHPLGSSENPVRVGGPEGERAYIARLRCADGSQPKVGQRGSQGIGAFGSIVDGYPLDCGGAAPGRTMLVMDMYHSEHVEERAPPGFTLAPR